jgi:hypothetical protein
VWRAGLKELRNPRLWTAVRSLVHSRRYSATVPNTWRRRCGCSSLGNYRASLRYQRLRTSMHVPPSLPEQASAERDGSGFGLADHRRLSWTAHRCCAFCVRCANCCNARAHLAIPKRYLFSRSGFRCQIVSCRLLNHGEPPYKTYPNVCSRDVASGGTKCLLRRFLPYRQGTDFLYANGVWGAATGSETTQTSIRGVTWKGSGRRVSRQTDLAHTRPHGSRGSDKRWRHKL